MKGYSIVKSIYHKIFLLFLFTPLSALADWDLNMRKGVTPISQDIYDMHMVTLWVVTVIGVLVFSVMFWSIFHHRKSKGVKPAKFSHSTTVEIIWTIIPTAINISVEDIDFITLTADGIDAPSSSFQWYINGELIENANESEVLDLISIDPVTLFELFQRL